jgi:hypothetical protein
MICSAWILVCFGMVLNVCCMFSMFALLFDVRGVCCSCRLHSKWVLGVHAHQDYTEPVPYRPQCAVLWLHK